jgi:hypothetical protein
MLDTIRFLEAMGVNPIAESEYAVAVAGLDVEESQRAALLERNHGALNDLLGGRTEMFFGVLAPDEGPLEEPFEDRPDDTPAEPDQDE